MKKHYFIVLAFITNIEKFPHRKGSENFPSFLANYDLDINGGMVIQSNIYDATKFINEKDAVLFMDKVKGINSDWDFEISKVGGRIFGKDYHRFVYPRQHPEC